MSAALRKTGKFEFTPANAKWARGQIKKYPKGRGKSAVMPLLTKAQEQNGGWLSIPAIEYVADFLEMPYIRVLEVATFYSMYHMKPVGKHVIEVCTTTPCWLCGSEDIVKACEDELGITFGETTKDGAFTLLEAECQGACVNAPMCAIKNRYYEDLTPYRMKEIIREFKAGKTPKPGPQIERQTSAPQSGPTTLEEFTKA